jgi:colanic acid biosynthesis protein WcaH
MLLDHQTLFDVVKHTPLVSVDLIVSRPNGEVLLGYRKNKPAQNTWFVPGGKIMKDERISAALRRVARTELGVELNPDQARFKGVYEHLYTDNFAGAPGVSTHIVVIAFETLVTMEDKIIGDDQHAQLKWWSVPELLAAPDVHPYTKAYFESI